MNVPRLALQPIHTIWTPVDAPEPITGKSHCHKTQDMYDLVCIALFSRHGFISGNFMSGHC